MKLDHETAQRLRTALGEIQGVIYKDASLTDSKQEELINMIGRLGFDLVDELEGVIR